MTPPAASGGAAGVIALIRPRHWLKNAFVLAPLVFAGAYTEGGAVLAALAAAALFSVAASAVYVLNDLADVAQDRTHPVKRRTRPLASGAVTPRAARILLGVLLVPPLVAAVVWPAPAMAVLLYIGINVAYSHGLKNVPVVDLFCVASGFVLRVWAGALAISVPLSAWMLITTLCLALYLAAGKRRQELSRRGAGSREVLGVYSLRLLDRYTEMSATAVILFYGLYVVEVQPGLAPTIPLVLFGLFRYWYRMEAGHGESPTDVIYDDLPLQLTVLAWIALTFVAVRPG